MSEALDEAFEQARDLPDEEQEALAELIIYEVKSRRPNNDPSDELVEEPDEPLIQPPAWSVQARNIFRTLTFVCMGMIPFGAIAAGIFNNSQIAVISVIGIFGYVLSFILWVGIVLLFFRCQFSLRTLLIFVIGIGACGTAICSAPGAAKLFGVIGFLVVFFLTIHGISKYDRLY